MRTAFYPRSPSEPLQDSKRGGKGGRDGGGNEEAAFYHKPTQESFQSPYRRASGVGGCPGEVEDTSTDFYVCLEDRHT